MSELREVPAANVFRFERKLAQVTFSPSESLEALLSGLTLGGSGDDSIQLASDVGLSFSSIRGRVGQENTARIIELKKAVIGSRIMALPLVNEMKVAKESEDEWRVHIALKLAKASTLSTVLHSLGIAERGILPVSYSLPADARLDPQGLRGLEAKMELYDPLTKGGQVNDKTLFATEARVTERVFTSEDQGIFTELH